MRDDIPTTDGFQLQLGPDGRCRILVGDPASPDAILMLSDDAADRLAQELANRRQTYDERGQPKGAAH